MERNNLPSIDSRSNLKGSYVLLRASLNVPVQDGKVVNTFRLRQSLATIEFLKKEGARIILVSHIGRDEHESLKPVYEALQEFIDLKFSSEVTGTQTTALRDGLQDGEVLLLENVRRDAREVMDDAALAQELADLADVFVNDDFAASHRAHASLHAVCSLLPSYVGFSFLREYEELSKVMHPSSPSLFILGGAKFETKMPLVEKYLDIYDHIFIGGALANDFLKAKGYEVGSSLVSDVSLADSPLLNHPKILLPVDVLALEGKDSRMTSVTDVREGESMLDIGPDTVTMLEPSIKQAKTILWNGPLGLYEQGYEAGTLACAELIAESEAFSVIGGGDTVAAIESLDKEGEFGFLSTAGGAMLTFLEEGTLIALEALKRSVR